MYFKRRPLPQTFEDADDNQLDEITINLTIEDEQHEVYKLNETEVVSFNESEYRAAGFAYEPLQGNKIGRIKFRGYLKRERDQQLVYVQIRFLCLYFSKTFDHARQFDDKWLLKQLKKWPASESQQCIESIADILEDKLEQFCQIKGTFKVKSEEEKELFFLGTVGRRMYSSKCKDSNVHIPVAAPTRKVFKMCGFDVDGNGFQVGIVKLQLGSADELASSSTTEYQYGFTSKQGFNFDLLLECSENFTSELFKSLLNGKTDKMELKFKFNNKITFQIEIQPYEGNSNWKLVKINGVDGL